MSDRKGLPFFQLLPFAWKRASIPLKLCMIAALVCAFMLASMLVLALTIAPFAIKLFIGVCVLMIAGCVGAMHISHSHLESTYLPKNKSESDRASTYLKKDKW